MAPRLKESGNADGGKGEYADRDTNKNPIEIGIYTFSSKNVNKNQINRIVIEYKLWRAEKARTNEWWNEEMYDLTEHKGVKIK